ncbi:hypothetical protein [Spirosoma aerophilum]
MKFRQLISLCFFLGHLINCAYGQSDSVRTEYKTEDDTISRSEIQRVVRYITRANIEEKTLLKFGVFPNSASYTQNGYVNTIGFNTELSVEHKLSPSFSVLLGIDNQLSINYTPRNANSRLSASPGQILWLFNRGFYTQSFAKVAVRHYYGMARRIREGRSANNFSGAYIGVQVRRPVFSYTQARRRELTSGEYRTEKYASSPGDYHTTSFGLQWGIQQRLGRRGYIDLNAGPELTFFNYDQPPYPRSGSQLSLRINAIIGLGW